jgi:hypothetical protein
MLWRCFVLVAAAVALAAAVSACGSSSGSSSASSAPELAGIIRIQIFGKFGGTKNEFDVARGTCKILKINTSAVTVKAGGEAILDHEKNASVLVAPAQGKATAAECRKRSKPPSADVARSA